jgi:Nucleoporin autopeptidase
VVVYPNDDAKPPLGQGLNRRAQVTLDRIYPTNKQTRAPIKDVDTIINMDYDTTLRKACYKMEARFIEYIPESGSWVFKVLPLNIWLIFSYITLYSQVDHFSKYGLPDDSDDDDDVTVANVTKPRASVQVPAKTPVMVQAQPPPAVPLKPHTLSNTHTSFNMSMTLPAIDSMEEGDPL